MSKEIKLGWYISRKIVGSEHGEVVYATMHEVVIRSQTGNLFVWSANSIRNNYQYIGPELPPQGEWVDIDLEKVALADLPIKARFRHDRSIEWSDPDQLCGFYSDDDWNFVCPDGMHWRYCQVWRPL